MNKLFSSIYLVLESEKLLLEYKLENATEASENRATDNGVRKWCEANGR